MSPDPYFDAFEEILGLQHVNLRKHDTAGLAVTESSGRVYLQSMTPGTPTAKIPSWRSRLWGAWLIKVGDTIVSLVTVVKSAFKKLIDLQSESATVLLVHPKIRPSVSHDGLPIVSSAPFTQHIHDQLNNWWEFTTVAQHLQHSKPLHQTVESGGVLNMVNRVMKLTRGKLLKQPDWHEWHDSEYLQLDQYYDQGMFGSPQLFGHMQLKL